MQPLELHGAGATPNPVKVAILIEELGLNYKVISYDISKNEHKEEKFTSLNPNGRLPALVDPNTGVSLFESGAIIEYLIETYDKEKKFQYETPEEKWLSKSWLHFQMSGQGPYFGQIYYFGHLHWEKVNPSVVERFQKEIKRVVGVIDAHLKGKGTPYLIGDKVTYADLAWIPWFNLATKMLVPDWKYQEEFPQFDAWLTKLGDRDAVKKVYANPTFQHH